MLLPQHSRRCLVARNAKAVVLPGQRKRRCTAIMASKMPHVMVNSCTGKMGQEVAAAALRAGLSLVPYTLCGAADLRAASHVDVSGQKVELVGPDTRDALVATLKSTYPNLIMVDYTIPDVIHEMVSFYVKHSLPFVMGTTGGDRTRIMSEVKAAELYAVIAPQMGKQVVAFQAMVEEMATSFPGAFANYDLRVVESHQSTKKDTSGTAKAIVSSFQRLGVEFDVSEIELVRTPEQQKAMGVPEGALGGHAFHTYRLTSPDGSVSFEFQHNVCGRRIYAEGTVDAVLFLARQIDQHAQQKVYNMIDVLKAGAMR